MAKEGSEPDHKQLSERATRVVVLLESFISRGTSTPLEKIVFYLMQHQEEQGSWGSSDYPPWRDVITAFAVQLMSRLGFHEGSVWEIASRFPAQTYEGGMPKAISYLTNSQQAHGGWGEDFFDTCQVLKAI